MANWTGSGVHPCLIILFRLDQGIQDYHLFLISSIGSNLPERGYFKNAELKQCWESHDTGG